MMSKYLFIPLFISLLSACSLRTPTIHTNCERNEIGNYILRWETNPVLEGTVSVSVSNDPDRFDGPATQFVDIAEGVTTYITDDNTNRQYFLLDFNNRYQQVVGSRSVAMDSVQNIRDLGGYLTSKGQMVRWGRVFRSGKLSRLSEWDSVRLDNLKIKTIIDLRSDRERELYPCGYGKATLVPIPIVIPRLNEIAERVEEGEIRKGDAFVAMQDEYIQFVTRNTEAFAQALRIFLDESRYPICVSCIFGKDRTGFLSMLLLYILGVPSETIRADYMSSNNYIDTSKFAQWATRLSSDSQESVTVFLAAHEELVDAIVHQINKDYGSIQDYLETGLRLSKEDQDKIREILLY